MVAGHGEAGTAHSGDQCQQRAEAGHCSADAHHRGDATGTGTGTATTATTNDAMVTPASPEGARAERKVAAADDRGRHVPSPFSLAFRIVLQKSTFAAPATRVAGVGWLGRTTRVSTVVTTIPVE